MSGWKTYAARLADQLVASGDLKSPAWYAAIGETPRHVLIPTVYEAQAQPYDSLSDARLNTADHPELVYSTTTLVTTVVPNEYGSLVPVSSSTKPDLMVRMLETLDIRKGQRVLEIGAGTGYNAALVRHEAPLFSCGDERSPPFGLSQQVDEAGGSLTAETRGRMASGPDKAGTCWYCQTVWVRRARREAVREEPVLEAP